MDERVDQYIQKQSDWKQRALRRLRNIIHDADPDITETIKWGAPYFEHAGGVAWVFCANEWIHLNFRHGALLESGHNRFEPTDNIANRTIKIREDEPLPADIIHRLIKQAVQNNIDGYKVKLVSPRPGTQVFDLPREYERYLEEHNQLSVYKQRPYYQQKGWIQWIESAKRDTTKQQRMKQMIHELRNDQYMPAKRDRF